MKEILTIFITILGAISVNNGKENANMVSFNGHAESEYFVGDVLPGGVDTQFYGEGGATLSARYMLKGVDNKGDSCSIFIENNGVFGEPYTKPRVITDSRALDFLNGAELKGKLDFSNQGLVIRIYNEEK